MGFKNDLEFPLIMSENFPRKLADSIHFQNWLQHFQEEEAPYIVKTEDYARQGGQKRLGMWKSMWKRLEEEKLVWPVDSQIFCKRGQHVDKNALADVISKARNCTLEEVLRDRNEIYEESLALRGKRRQKWLFEAYKGAQRIEGFRWSTNRPHRPPQFHEWDVISQEKLADMLRCDRRNTQFLHEAGFLHRNDGHSFKHQDIVDFIAALYETDTDDVLISVQENEEARKLTSAFTRNHLFKYLQSNRIAPYAFYSLKDAASLTGHSISTISQAANRDDLPTVQIGQKRLVQGIYIALYGLEATQEKSMDKQRLRDFLGYPSFDPEKIGLKANQEARYHSRTQVKPLLRTIAPHAIREIERAWEKPIQVNGYHLQLSWQAQADYCELFETPKFDRGHVQDLLSKAQHNDGLTYHGIVKQGNYTLELNQGMVERLYTCEKS